MRANLFACMHFSLPLCSPHVNRNPAGELVVCHDTIVPRLKKVAIKQSFTYTHARLQTELRIQIDLLQS